MNDFTVKLKTVLDSSTVTKQIKELDKKATVHIKTDTTQASKGIKTIKQDLDGVNNSAKKVNQSFGQIVFKVGKFLAATTIIGGFTTAVYSAVEAMKDFDSALTDFKKVSDLSGDTLNDYTKKLGQMGLEVARTRKLMCVGV